MILELERCALTTAGRWDTLPHGKEVKFLRVLFTSEAKIEHKIERCGVCTDLVILISSGEEGVKPKDKALDLSVIL